MRVLQRCKRAPSYEGAFLIITFINRPSGYIVGFFALSTFYINRSCPYLLSFDSNSNHLSLFSLRDSAGLNGLIYGMLIGIIFLIRLITKVLLINFTD